MYVGLYIDISQKCDRPISLFERYLNSRTDFYQLNEDIMLKDPSPGARGVGEWGLPLKAPPPSEGYGPDTNVINNNEL